MPASFHPSHATHARRIRKVKCNSIWMPKTRKSWNDQDLNMVEYDVLAGVFVNDYIKYSDSFGFI
jgi:hypothetical protein